MNTILSTQRRRVCASTLALSFGAFLSACGGGGSEAPSAAPSPAPAPAQAPAPAPAPVSAETIGASTFVVGILIETPVGKRFQNIGTAFAIEERLLATSAAVSQQFLLAARAARAAGGRVVGASAFQSNTGKEFQLITAMVHPSYENVARSEDVGLLQTRDALPSRLELAAPEETATLIQTSDVQLSGFVALEFNSIFGNGFAAETSRPQSSLMSGKVEMRQNFDSRVEVKGDDTVDMYGYPMGSGGGTSGSPVLHNGKVVAVHNSEIRIQVQVERNGNVTPALIPSNAGKAGIHVKHLRSLLKVYKEGVLDADRKFILPPPDTLLLPAAVRSAVGGAFQGAVANGPPSFIDHALTISVDQNLNVTGTARWPATAGRNFPQAVNLTLKGTLQDNGTVAFTDNMPEVEPRIQQGIYQGKFDSASGKFSGSFSQINADTKVLTLLGTWEMSR